METIADPVVYKLVRVEGDGRLVPATDDEIMEVEDFLVDEQIELPVVTNAGNVECISNESSSGKPQKESSEGLLPSEDTEADAKLSSHLEEIVPSSALSLDGSINESGRKGERSKHPDGPIESGSSASLICLSSKLDFYASNEEICLDNLSIRELHELFRATFGRETTVKDKLWLKRRIAMGLTNSCDVSTTTFTIINNKLLKDKDDSLQNTNGMHAEGSDGGPKNLGYEDSPASHSSQLENHQVVSAKRSGNLSEEEYGTKIAGHEETSLTSCARPLRNVPSNEKTSNERTIVTRLDSLGGSGVQVPYVSRVRRSRPRKNIMALMKFDPSGMGVTAKLFATEPEKDKQRSVMSTIEHGKNLVLKQTDSSEDNSDDSIVAVPTVKGGMRRKHHRAWTLVEVMKLVEGVSKCGTGRWSEIKRLSFASYSYRTSVDLKDKWRNLLKASFAQNLLMMSRKHAAVPIPAPILLKVRELAEMHAQVPPNVGPRLATNGSRSLHQTRSGYL
ncbi:hypothetical protein M0R45_032121 [Rubus argutus]|uniref:Uncharacterized protein n=1 Tax=Rubus argutus TaxID=59490 RepID=A0AAW1WFL5_RUBAR